MRWTLRRLSVLVLLLAACPGKESSWSTAAPVAMVNGEPIGVVEFQKKLEKEAALAAGEATPSREEMSSLKEEVLNHLIDEKVMLQRAGQLSLAVSAPEIAARIGEIKKDYGADGFDALFGNGGIDYPAWEQALQQRLLLEKVITRDVNAKIHVTDGEAESYFKANRKTYVSAQRVRVAQIVIRDRNRAEGILKRLKAGEDFGKVAREVSIGPEAERGGDLGFFERGMMPEAIDRVVFSLPEGKLSSVVQSPYGFHVFKVLEKENARGRRFTDIKERVRADLRKAKEAEEYERWIEGLRKTAVIRIKRPLPDGPATQPTKMAAPPTAAGKQ